MSIGFGLFDESVLRLRVHFMLAQNLNGISRIITQKIKKDPAKWFSFCEDITSNQALKSGEVLADFAVGNTRAALDKFLSFKQFWDTLGSMKGFIDSCYADGLWCIENGDGSVSQDTIYEFATTYVNLICGPRDGSEYYIPKTNNEPINIPYAKSIYEISHALQWTNFSTNFPIFLSQRNMREVGRFETESLFAVILADLTNSDLILIFRGSKSTKDWASNVDFAITEGYHRGFYKIYIQKHAEIQAALLEHMHPDTGAYKDFKLVFAGSSRGGSMAQLAASKMHEILKISLIYSFGTPPSMIASKASELNLDTNIKGIYRLVNKDDLVPRMMSMRQYWAGVHYHLSSDDDVNPQELSWTEEGNLQKTPISLTPETVQQHQHYFGFTY
eukprot:41974_1